MLSLARSLCVVLLACLCAFVLVPVARAQQSPQSESSGVAAHPRPSETLREAQTIFIRSKSVLLKPAALEQALLDRSEVQRWELVISRDETDADLIIEVQRKLFTNIFVYSVIDPHTQRVLLSGKVGSLGGTVEGQIANGFVKRMQRFR